MRRAIRRLLFASLIAAAPALARAESCADLARPATFDAASAMLAIYCQYDAAHGGTLVPVALTQGWRVKQAEILAEPMLAETYVEGGVTKGVLAVARKSLSQGEVVGAHASGATISIYVFRKDSDRFVFEKGKKAAIAEAGSYGEPPEVELKRLGDDRWGLWFTGGYTGQGTTVSNFFVHSLSDPASFPELLSLLTGEDNGGACSDDGSEGPSCYGWEAKVDLVPVAGEAWDRIRVRYSGTELTDGGEGRPKKGVECYARRGEKYVEVKDPECARRKAR